MTYDNLIEDTVGYFLFYFIGYKINTLYDIKDDKYNIKVAYSILYVF